MAVVYAKEQFRPYLYKRKFIVVIEHRPLKYYFNSKSPDLCFNQLKEKIRGSKFSIIYHPGDKNLNADALSRNPVIREDKNNPELSRVDMYNLTDDQKERGINYEDFERIFRLRAQKIAKDGDKIKIVKDYDSESETDEPLDKRKQKEDDILFDKGTFLAALYYNKMALENYRKPRYLFFGLH